LIQSTSNVVDLAGAAVSKDTWKQGLQAMPDQYLRNRAAMRHFLSVDNEIAYRDSLANRETAMGDAQIQGVSPVFGFGVALDAASLMPAANALTCNPLNMIFGIQRDIHIETDKDITARVYIIVLTMRMDFKFEEEEAVVKYTNMG
jgi:hypothetical protein